MSPKSAGSAFIPLLPASCYPVAHCSTSRVFVQSKSRLACKRGLKAAAISDRGRRGRPRHFQDSVLSGDGECARWPLGPAPGQFHRRKASGQRNLSRAPHCLDQPQRLYQKRPGIFQRRRAGSARRVGDPAKQRSRNASINARTRLGIRLRVGKTAHIPTSSGSTSARAIRCNSPRAICL